MANINKIKLSGTTYNIQDENAQPLLTAGQGITIENNVISATGGSGGSGATVIEVTQAQYDALVSTGTLDLTALYIITDATEIDISNYWTSAQTESAITQALGGLKLVKLSQSEYDSLATKDDNTVYFIGDSNGYTMKIGNVNVN